MSLDKILAELGIEQEQEKTASAGSSPSLADGDDFAKLAEDLEAAGALMAESFFNKVAQLNKEAADRASSSHASPGGVTEPSNWSMVAQRLQRLAGHPVPGDEGHIRAENAYKRTMGRSPQSGGESY